MNLYNLINGKMHIDPNGQWVKWEEVKQLQQAMKEGVGIRIASLEKEIRELKQKTKQFTG